MRSHWIKKNLGRAVALVLLAVVAVTVWLIPGTTLGRYLTEQSQGLMFTVSPGQQLYLLSDRSEDAQLLTTLTHWTRNEQAAEAEQQPESTQTEPAPEAPTETNDESTESEPSVAAETPAAEPAAATAGQSICFCVSNADLNGQNYTDKDISFRVRVFVPDTVDPAVDETTATNPGKLNIGLCLSYDGTVYTAPIKATPTYLSARSARCILDGGMHYWAYTFCIVGQEQAFTLPGGAASDLYIKITLDDETIDAKSFVLQVEEVRK